MPGLDSPLNIGVCRLKNRIGFAPVNLGSAFIKSSELASIVKVYEQLALGDLGLAYVGGIAVNRQGRSNRSSMLMSSTTATNLLGGIVELRHKYGMAAAVQLMHSGRQASRSEVGGPILAPSEIPCPYYNEVPASATASDIRSVVRDFAGAASLAASIGCDLIEIHAAHGYLVSGFLSRSTNKRTDEYGGSVSRRFRILDQILQEVHSITDVSLGVRVNVFEHDPFGLQPDELVEGLIGLKAGLDFVSVSGGMYTAGHDDVIIPRRSKGDALWRSQSRYVRRGLQVPTMIAGNISTVNLANELVASGDADVVLMARALLADPHLYVKSTTSRAGEIQPCTELYLCKYHSRGASHVYCPHNPVMRSSLLPKVEPHSARRRSKDR